MKKLLFLLAICFLLLAISLPVKAQFTDLLDFNTTNGAGPTGSLCFNTLHDTLFGLSPTGGAYNDGLIFSIKPDGTGFQDLYDFGSGDLNPYGSLALAGSTLYGIATYGGAYGYGGIFSIGTNGSNYSEIHDFNGTDGAYGYGSLSASVTRDTLFGITSYGGIYGYGNIFYISTNGTIFNDIYDFDNTDGSEPYGSVTLTPDGKSLVGMCNSGGTSSYGTAFIVNTDGSGFYTIHNFTGGTDGASPYGDLVFSVTHDSLFGLSSSGGNSGYGNLFTIVAGSGLTDLFDFGGAAGATPEGDVTVEGNKLYGMTSAGGVGSSGNVFSVHTDGSHYADMLDFFETYGAEPYGSLVMKNNVLYGMASQGGEFSYGIIFGDSILSANTITIQNITCTSGNVGKATADVRGGATPYTYYWMPGESTNQTIMGLSMGTYTVEVVDARGSTATSVAVISGVQVHDSLRNNISCYGADDGVMMAVISGGTPPFAYLWSTGATHYFTGPLSPGSYTVTVTDLCGATATASASITQPGPVPTPTIVALSTDSIGFRVTWPIDSLIYSWTLTDVTGTYSGSGDTAHLPIWPRNATLTFYAEAPTTTCTVSASIHITHNEPLPVWGNSYPRWSKRGVELEYACHYFTPKDGGDSIRLNGTPFVTWCRNNHITYVLMDGVDWLVTGSNANSCGVFYVDSSTVNDTDAPYFENFIDSLKTRGGVEEVGVECYKSDEAGISDTNPYGVEVFNCSNVAGGVGIHNMGLPWEKKVDILSLDYEWWGAAPRASITGFHKYVIPMLKSMYGAAHECDSGFLRVEDYIAEPMYPGNSSFDFSNSIETMEADSIKLYTDRVLNSVYSEYPGALWNEADFRLAYPDFGDSINRNMEIWPMFSAENYSHTSSNSSSDCPLAWYKRNDNYSGTDLCYLNKFDTADWIEQQYYDTLNIGAERKEFTSSLTGDNVLMGADTNFRILGDMWYDYRCLQIEGINFDTLMKGTHKGYLRYYVTLPHDTQYIRINDLRQDPITFTATVHGGKGPFTYTWYNLRNGAPLLTGASSSYTDYFNFYSSYYNTSKLGVIVKDAGDSSVSDYMNIYEICNQFHYESPVRVNPTNSNDSTANIPNSVKVYPNPNQGSFTLALQNVNGNSQVSIYNILGEEVKKEELITKNNSIDMSTQPDGVYFWRVLSDKGKSIGSGKLIIEK